MKILVPFLGPQVFVVALFAKLSTDCRRDKTEYSILLHWVKQE